MSAFLSAVFEARDAQVVASTVCAGWYAEDALARTLAEVGPGPVTWDGIGIVSQRRRPGDRQGPGPRHRPETTQWRFNLVLEAGQWRVCEARPFTL